MTATDTAPQSTVRGEDRTTVMVNNRVYHVTVETVRNGTRCPVVRHPNGAMVGRVVWVPSLGTWVVAGAVTGWSPRQNLRVAREGAIRMQPETLRDLIEEHEAARAGMRAEAMKGA